MSLSEAPAAGTAGLPACGVACGVAVEAAAVVLAALLFIVARLAAKGCVPSVWRRRLVPVACAVHLGAAVAFSALVPVAAPAPLELPGLTRLLGCHPAGLLHFLNHEGMVAAVPALLLPLPLGWQLACSALALREVLPRMRALATAHAALPGAGAQCRRVVATMRLALQAVAPGTPVPLPELQDVAACWMLHTWVLLAFGFCMPAAAGIALQRFERQQRRAPGSGPSKAGSGASRGSQQSPKSEAGQPAAMAESPASGPSRQSGSMSPRSYGSHSSLSSGAVLAAMLPPPRSPSQSSSGSLAARAPSSVSCLLGRLCDHPATALAAQLAPCLLLLLPVWSCVWAGLELSQAGPPSATHL